MQAYFYESKLISVFHMCSETWLTLSQSFWSKDVAWIYTVQCSDKTIPILKCQFPRSEGQQKPEGLQSADMVVWRVSRQNENMIPDGHIVFSKRSTGYETFILMANGDQSDYRHGNHADRQRSMALN